MREKGIMSDGDVRETEDDRTIQSICPPLLFIEPSSRFRSQFLSSRLARTLALPLFLQPHHVVQVRPEFGFDYQQRAQCDEGFEARRQRWRSSIERQRTGAKCSIASVDWPLPAAAVSAEGNRDYTDSTAEGNRKGWDRSVLGRGGRGSSDAFVRLECASHFVADLSC